jgi:hypothetical protein
MARRKGWNKPLDAQEPSKSVKLQVAEEAIVERFGMAKCTTKHGGSLNTSSLQRLAHHNNIPESDETVHLSSSHDERSSQDSLSSTDYITVLAFESSTTDDSRKNSFMTLRLTYLVVTLVIMLADGLQGMICSWMACSLYLYYGRS